jgi:hypothetical protein
LGTENGISSGATIRTAASPRRPPRRPAPPPPATASTRSAFTATTTNVTPQTPAIVANRTVAWLSTCETPSEPQLKPPSGHDARIQSITVHSDARPTAVRTGRPRRITAGARSPNTTAEAVQRRVSDNHAICPKRSIQ